MEKLKEQLVVTNVDINGCQYARLNMPLKEICHRIGVAGFDIFDKLKELGIETGGPILVSQQDIDDYKSYEREHPVYNPDCSEAEEFAAGVNCLIANSAYFDQPLTDDNGNVGLIDTLGNIVVPPLFDSAEGTSYLFHAQNKAIVKKDGKFWLTPRDGSGQIININRGYDSINPYFHYAYVIRDGKHGLVDLTTGHELIPSEMDWLKQVVNDYVFGKDGKIGYYSVFDCNESLESEPLFDAINLTTRQFMKDGEWGWYLKGGVFTTEIPCEEDRSFQVVWKYEHFIDTNPDEEERYITLEELTRHLKASVRKMSKERTRTLASRLNLPSLRFPKGFTAIEEIEGSLTEILKRCVKEKRKEVKIWFGTKSEGEPIVDVNFLNKGKGMTMQLEWIDDDLKDQWRDIKLPEKMQKFLNVIIYASKERPVLKFTRQFEASQVKLLSKFLTYYIVEFRQIARKDIIAYVPENLLTSEI